MVWENEHDEKYIAKLQYCSTVLLLTMSISAQDTVKAIQIHHTEEKAVLNTGAYLLVFNAHLRLDFPISIMSLATAPSRKKIRSPVTSFLWKRDNGRERQQETTDIVTNRLQQISGTDKSYSHNLFIYLFLKIEIV